MQIKAYFHTKKNKIFQKSLEKTVSTQEISTGIVDQLKQLKQWVKHYMG